MQSEVKAEEDGREIVSEEDPISSFAENTEKADLLDNFADQEEGTREVVPSEERSTDLQSQDESFPLETQKVQEVAAAAAKIAGEIPQELFTAAVEGKGEEEDVDTDFTPARWLAGAVSETVEVSSNEDAQTKLEGEVIEIPIQEEPSEEVALGSNDVIDSQPTQPVFSSDREEDRESLVVVPSASVVQSMDAAQQIAVKSKQENSSESSSEVSTVMPDTNQKPVKEVFQKDGTPASATSEIVGGQKSDVSLDFKETSKVQVDSQELQTTEAQFIDIESLLPIALLPERESNKLIWITVTEEKVVLSAQKQTSENRQQIVNSDAPAPMTSLEEVSEAVDVIDRLAAMSAPQVTKEVTLGGKEEQTPKQPDVTIVVSEEMLDVIKTLMEEEDTSVDVAAIDSDLESKEGESQAGEKQGENSEDYILVTNNKDKIILGAPKSSLPPNDRQDKPELAPVTTIADLKEVFDYVALLPENSQLQTEVAAETPKVEAPETPDIEIIVSDSLLKLLGDVHSELPQQAKNDEDEKPLQAITFRANSEEKKQLRIDNNRFLQIRQVLIESKVFNGESNYQVTTGLHQEVREVQETVIQQSVKNDRVENKTEYKSESTQPVIIFDLTWTKDKKAATQVSQPMLENQSRRSRDQLVYLTSGEREIRIELLKLRRLIELQKKRELLNSSTLLGVTEQSANEQSRNMYIQDPETSPMWFRSQLLRYVLSLPEVTDSDYVAEDFRNIPLVAA